MSKTHGVTSKVRETVINWKLWGGGEELLLAVSGGIDSMVLWDVLEKLPQEIRPNLQIIHFNHNLRGSESDQDELFVQSEAKRRGVPVFTEKAPPWKSKSNLQETARNLRYDFFQRIAKQQKIAKVTLAHQANDQAETFLIRWIQGAGLKGLGGMPLARDNIVRPLLFVTRAEIEDYARRFEVPFREDPSNADEKYLRNRIRKLLPAFRDLNENLEARSSLNQIFLKADDECLSKLTRQILDDHFDDGFSISLYLSLPEALRYRLLQIMGKGLNGDFVLKIDRLLRDPKPQSWLNLPHRLKFEKDYVKFRFALNPDRVLG